MAAGTNFVPVSVKKELEIGREQHENNFKEKRYR